MNLKLSTELFCEPDCIKKHIPDIIALGNKALIVTGKHSSKVNGSLYDVESVLKNNNINYRIFDQVDENPSVENILQAVHINKDFGTDFVIGIGGGSPLDAAKAIALMLANPDCKGDLLYESIKVPYLPVIAIPTTCGTGSEVTPYSILTIHERRTKSSISHKIYPSLALINPDYLSSASPSLIKMTLIDALGHLIESYINTNSTLISRMFCDKGFELWRLNDQISNISNITYHEKENLMMCSALAGMAITHTGTSLPHGMSYQLTYENSIPHGKAVGTFLAAYLSYADKHDKQHILSALGYKSCDLLGDRINNYIGEVSMTSFEIEFAVNSMLENNKKLANCPFTVDEKTMRDIYTRSVVILKNVHK